MKKSKVCVAHLTRSVLKSSSLTIVRFWYIVLLFGILQAI